MKRYCYFGMYREEGATVPTVLGSKLLFITVVRELTEMSSGWSKILLPAISQQMKSFRRRGCVNS
jgi:hypothetical protein